MKTRERGINMILFFQSLKRRAGSTSPQQYPNYVNKKFAEIKTQQKNRKLFVVAS